MTVYLIHLDAPLHHARHYVGYAEHVKQRLAHHRQGTGARILAVCNERGIEYDIVRTWEGAGKTFERKLKNCKHAARYCPKCTTRPRDYNPKLEAE
ncbi:MAG: endonuclease [Chloroflexota bacterium]|jgi:predicted GIY-YIG superfamily endonuclease